MGPSSIRSRGPNAGLLSLTRTHSQCHRLCSISPLAAAGGARASSSLAGLALGLQLLSAAWQAPGAQPRGPPLRPTINMGGQCAAFAQALFASRHGHPGPVYRRSGGQVARLSLRLASKCADSAPSVGPRQCVSPIGYLLSQPAVAISAAAGRHAGPGRLSWWRRPWPGGRQAGLRVAIVPALFRSGRHGFVARSFRARPRGDRENVYCRLRAASRARRNRPPGVRLRRALGQTSARACRSRHAGARLLQVSLAGGVLAAIHAIRRSWPRDVGILARAAADHLRPGCTVSPSSVTIIEATERP
jgi:hypothetical protein